ncbi:MAG: SAM-dependent methyltransferase [Polyangiales bacterium]
MRDSSPSGTSFLVSFARGLGVDGEEIDPLAHELLPFWLARLAAAPAALGGFAGFYRNAVRATTFGLVDHIVLRTKAIDVQILEALRSGIDQLVILGAGLDARAWRLPELKHGVVFEVDHPATQTYKRSRVDGRIPPGALRYIAVDFEKERFSDGLRRAGFRSDSPSVWIWEGVTMYLPLAAIHDSLEQVTSLAAPGSQLAITYRVPGALPFGALGRTVIPVLYAAGGEPLKAAFAPHELAALLGPAWGVLYDEDSYGWQKLTSSIASPARNFISERLAIATRKD